MRQKLLSLFTIAVIIYLPARSADTTLYVSPGGKGNGGKRSPTSLERAVSLLPQLKKRTKKGTVTIILEGGTYELNEPVHITPENGGTRDLKIIFTAEDNAHPVISGGRKIWLQGTNVLSADVSSVLIGDLPQDIYINGKRAIRARTPNFGFLRFSQVREKQLPGLTEGRAMFQQYFEIPETTYATLQKLSPRQLKMVRFDIYHKWNTTSRTIDSLSTTGWGFYSAGPAWASYNPIDSKSLFFLENDQNALDTAGEWILDNNRELKYIPQDSACQKAEAVIPVVEKLLVISGDSSHLVTNVWFNGISFCYANKPFSGFEDSQAASSVDAAIMLDDAQDIHFNNCSIMHTGQYAIWFRKNVKRCSMQKCYIDDLGAGGIRIGETTLPGDTTSFTSNIRISNCIIHSGGYNYPPAVGVFIAHAANNIIEHNDIADFRYTGVSVGWLWGYAYSPAINNKIVYNHIHHIGWGVLSDMAGVYTLGVSPGTEVSHNVVNDVFSYDYGGWGLYTDEGSSYIRMEDNLVYRTKTGGFHQHYGKNNLIDNNIFAFSIKYLAQDSRIEDHLSFEFKHNIMLSGGETFLQGCWKTGRVDIDSNCYWIMGTPRDNPFIISTMQYGSRPVDNWSFKQWLSQSGRDEHSLFQNPGFDDPEHYDFHIRNISTVKRVGFTPFDYETAGVTGDAQWKKLAILPADIIRDFNRSVRKIMLD